MTPPSASTDVSRRGGLPPQLGVVVRILGVAVALYFFIVGVGGMGESFKLFGKEFAERLLTATSNPFTAISIGILATSLVQSSSTSTSIIVGMVAGGALSMQSGVYMIMGANIGTTITSMLVSLGHMHRRQELQRAFSVSSVHAIFNLLTVCILLPLEWSTGALSSLAGTAAEGFRDVGGMKLSNPLKAATQPTIDLIAWVCLRNGWLMLLATIILTYGMLVAIVKLLRSLVLDKVEAFFDTHIFRNSARAMFFGLVLTFAVQTSSVPTALVVPLAGAGVLRLMQVYPFCLGANMGTTMTALLASLATGSPVALQAAFAHLLFNIIGILIIWPIPAIRSIPVKVATAMGALAARNRIFPVSVVAGVYFVIPALLIIILRII